MAQLEKNEGLQRKLKLSIPAAKIEEKYKGRLQKLAKTAKLDGFRPGKVPAEVLEKRYGQGVRQEVLTELMDESFREAVSEHKLQIAGRPEIIDDGSLIKLSASEPFEFTAQFEVYPEIDLKDLSGQSLECLTSNINDAEVDAMLERVRKQHTDWQEVPKAAQDGDQVTIDFTGMLNGEKFEGGSAKNFQLVLGSKQMIPGFEEGILGLKKGDEKDITVTFPADYHAKELAGKETVFHIHVHKVASPNLPEVDDEFAKKLGITEGGVAKLKERVRQNMELELEAALKNDRKNKAFDKLIEVNQFDIPEALIEAEIVHLQNLTRQQMARQQNSDKLPKIDLPRDPYVEQARKRVALGLLLAEVIKKHDIKLDQERLKAKINEMAASYGDHAEEMVKWYYSNKELLAEVESFILEEQAVELLLKDATINEKKVPFEDLLNQQA